MRRRTAIFPPIALLFAPVLGGCGEGTDASDPLAPAGEPQRRPVAKGVATPLRGDDPTPESTRTHVGERIDVALTVHFEDWADDDPDGIEVRFGGGTLVQMTTSTRGHERGEGVETIRVARPAVGGPAEVMLSVPVRETNSRRRRPYAWAEVLADGCLPTFARTDGSNYTGLLPTTTRVHGTRRDPREPWRIELLVKRGTLIQGIVLDPAGEDPVAAEVFVLTEGERGAAVLVGKTEADREGRYGVPIAFEGRCVVAAMKEGVGTAASEIHLVAANEGVRLDPLTLIGGRPYECLVQNELGEPVPEIEVRASVVGHTLAPRLGPNETYRAPTLETYREALASGPFRGSARCDSRGLVEFPALTPGTYWLRSTGGLFEVDAEVTLPESSPPSPVIVEAKGRRIRFRAREEGGAPIAWHPTGQVPLDPETSAEARVSSYLLFDEHRWSRGTTPDTWYFWHADADHGPFEFELAGRPLLDVSITLAHAERHTETELVFAPPAMAGRLMVTAEGHRGESLENLSIHIWQVLDPEKRDFRPEELRRAGKAPEVELMPGRYSYTATLEGDGFDYGAFGDFEIESGKTTEHVVELLPRGPLRIRLTLPDGVSLPITQSFELVVRPADREGPSTQYGVSAVEIGVPFDPRATIEGDVVLPAEILDEGIWRIRLSTSSLQSEWQTVTVEMGQQTTVDVVVEPR